jgi:hypothetical protein
MEPVVYAFPSAARTLMELVFLHGARAHIATLSSMFIETSRLKSKRDYLISSLDLFTGDPYLIQNPCARHSFHIAEKD